MSSVKWREAAGPAGCGPGPGLSSFLASDSGATPSILQMEELRPPKSAQQHGASSSMEAEGGGRELANVQG